MKIDFYTKLMLTVIAGALVGLIVQNSTSNAIAQGAVQKVIICDAHNTNSCATVGKVSNRNFTLSVTDFKVR